MVSRTRKAVVGLAGLALAGGACLGGIAAAPIAGAASPACGSSCWSLYNQKFGSADVSAVSGVTAATGQAVILAAATSSTAEDWRQEFNGTVADFYAAGLMNATLNQYYGSDQVWQFEYAPGGIDSGECLGIASGPGQGTKVTLQPCTEINSTWIYDSVAAVGGYVPYISGADTKYPAPYVLTATLAGDDFTTQALRVDSTGVAAKDQMWQLISGVLGSLTLGTWPGTTGPAAAAEYYGYPYPDAPVCPASGGPQCKPDQWNFYQGQCTSWVAYRLNELNGIAFNNSYGGNGTWGNAMYWGPHALSLGITVNSTPTVGSVAWWSSSRAHPSGHVAYVEQVNSPTSIVISEMNYDGDNGFRVRTIRSSSGDWPTDFIHIQDR
jgi:surface antigen